MSKIEDNNFHCVRAGIFLVLGLNAMVGFAVASWFREGPPMVLAAMATLAFFTVSAASWDSRERG